MASIWRRAMVYLGLVDDDEYDEYEPYPPEQPAPRPVRRAPAVPMDRGRDAEPVMSGVRTLPPRDSRDGRDPRDPRDSRDSRVPRDPREGREVREVREPQHREPAPDSGISIPRGAVVRPLQPMQSPKVHVVAPGGFNDAQEIGDRLKASQPVIVNLQGVQRDLSRRLIDFASGLSYGLGGAMEKVADSVFLLTPSNVEVSADEKRRLQERGLYRS